jgi:hypothetical protein
LAHNIDKQELAIRYLLGTLSSEEAERLDVRYFTDESELEELEIAEEELVDRFVRNELSAENALRLEKVLKYHPRLRERVEFARILAKKVPVPDYEEPVTEPAEDLPPKKDKRGPKPPWWGIFWGASTEPAPALRFAFVGAVVLTMLATVALLVVWSRLRAESQRLALEQQQRQQKERDLANEKARAEGLQAQLDKATEENKQRENRIAQLEQQRQQQEEELRRQQRQPQQSESFFTAVLHLSPGTSLRGVGSSRKPFQIPPKTQSVQLNLDVGGDSEYVAYNASVNDMNKGGTPVWQKNNVSSFPYRGSKYIRLEVPRDRLPPGSYSVAVEGLDSSGQAEPLPDYSFRIGR